MTKNGLEHVAMIMDGNGRWAKERGFSRIEGHKKGVENVRKILDACKELGIKYVTLYAFSSENWNRPKLEVNALMTLLRTFLKKERDELVRKGIRLNVIGRVNELPKGVQKELHKTIEATADLDESVLTLALNYGSRLELIDAVKAYTEKVQKGEECLDDLDWSRLNAHLYTSDLPDPDLVIRTSGECRVSNFLLMQSAYSEYYFTPVYWPDFGPDRLRKAVDTYGNRERRFGKTSAQLKK
tara:strand:- start:479 stop:1201 length:723 start_codon:yes stop_codon:yes gene_type:complete